MSEIDCRGALLEAIKTCGIRFPSCAILLSGGVDTAAIASAYIEEKIDSPRILSAVTVLCSDYYASDRYYFSISSSKLNIRHDIIEIGMGTLLEDARTCIRALKTFDGMTLRNSLVIAAVKTIYNFYSILITFDVGYEKGKRTWRG